MKLNAKISISRNPSMADERVDITISGLERAQKVTLHGSTILGKGEEFESFSHYVAGEDGRICLDQQHSLGGTYMGIEPMGPFWSLTPSPCNKRKHERFVVKDTSNPFTVRLRVYESFLSLEEIKNSPEKLLSAVDVERTYSSPGVRCEEVRHGRVRGYLFLPPGRGTFPGVISMSGGTPGALKFKGALLASHGYATLSLKYFGEDDLPKVYTDLDLTYFEEAAVYLKHHPRVSAKNGVGFVANCLGGCLALSIAAVAPRGLIKCVVSINGWFFSYWRLKYGDKVWQRPPNVKSEVEMNLDGSLRIFNESDLSDPYNPALWTRLFKFYKRRDVGFMLIYGENDASLNAKSLSSCSKTLLKNENHENCEVLVYPDAGHLIEHSCFPLVKALYDGRRYVYYGGVQPGHARAQEQSWQKILKFLRRNLSPEEQSKL